jgi:transposase IS66 family protein
VIPEAGPATIHGNIDLPSPLSIVSDSGEVPGNGKTKTARLWVYVRDDRASADMTPPAVWFAYTPDRKGIHPQQHLESFSGTLQADAYGGYQALYETGRVTEAACWAHARRQFYELHASRPNALNTEALERIGTLYRIEEAIRGKAEVLWLPLHPAVEELDCLPEI